ncbi:MAG: site-specific DNA-methyltransferase [Nannocystaceae bacterium]|nr:site-specific DNA-methyltransferase [bacterium]
MSFGLDFADKSAVLASLDAPGKARLRTRRDRSDAFETASTALVEGDNLDMLRLLQPAYAERVQLIYMDPPYNTGRDFVYRDRFGETAQAFLERTGQVDETGTPLRPNPRSDGRYHSAWLAMMYPRLWHARALLHPQGLLCVSIDDHEVHHLRMLLDEIFGEACFIAQVVVVTNRGGRDYLRIATGHEYLLVYGATPDAVVRELPKPPPKDALHDERGPYVLRELRNRNPKFHPGNRPNLFYPFFVDTSRDDGRGGLAVSLEPRAGYDLQVEPRNAAGEGSVWRWGRPKAEAAVAADDPGGSSIVAKQRRDGGFNIYEKHRKSTAKAKGLWDEPAMRTEQGTIDLRQALGRPVFDHPKPVALVRRCIELATDPGGIVLDPFAGSGTTAEAAAALAERFCVLGQWPEPVSMDGFETICDVTRARVARRCGGVRVFELAPEGAESAQTVEALREAEATRMHAFDPFARALQRGVGLHGTLESRAGWTVLRDDDRAFAWSVDPGAIASVEGLALPERATIVVPDDAWSNAERLALAGRWRVESM